MGRSFNTGAAEPENALRPGTPPHRAAAFAAPERKELLLSCDRSCDSAMHDGLGQQLHVVTQKGHSRPVDVNNVNPVVGRGGSSSRELQANMRKIRGCRGCRPRVSSQVLGEPHRGPGNRPATGLHAHVGTLARAYTQGGPSAAHSQPIEHMADNFQSSLPGSGQRRELCARYVACSPQARGGRRQSCRPRRRQRPTSRCRRPS